MGTHVDIIRNRWHAGSEMLVAVVIATPSGVKVDSLDGNDWSERVLRPYLDQSNGQVIDPGADPERFVSLLHTAMNGTYVSATPPHDDASCRHPRAAKIQGELEAV